MEGQAAIHSFIPSRSCAHTADGRGSLPLDWGETQTRANGWGSGSWGHRERPGSREDPGGEAVALTASGCFSAHPGLQTTL